MMKKYKTEIYFILLILFMVSVTIFSLSGAKVPRIEEIEPEVYINDIKQDVVIQYEDGKFYLEPTFFPKIGAEVFIKDKLIHLKWTRYEMEIKLSNSDKKILEVTDMVPIGKTQLKYLKEGENIDSKVNHLTKTLKFYLPQGNTMS